MTDHIIDISDDGAFLGVDLGRLMIDREGREPAYVPLAEIAAVVISHPRVTISRAALAGLCENGGCVVVCGENRLPAGLLLPIGGFHAPAQRFAAQASVTLPLRKRLWKQIITAKIAAQGRVLQHLRENDRGLLGMSRCVRSGDPDNLEGQAARRYWKALFESKEFFRDVDGVDQNRFLNYGYAVLRALVGRAICAAGLHPGLGLHHHHRANPYCLADDLMEPFRPIVDRVVVRIIEEHGAEAELMPEIKRKLIEPFTGACRYSSEGEERTMMDLLARVASSLGLAFEKGRGNLFLPEL